MTGTVAGELLVLAHRPDDGRRLGRAAELDLGLAGALIGELVLDGVLTVTDGRLRAPGPAPADAELADVTRAVADGSPAPPRRWVRRLAGGGRRRRLLQRLVAAGRLRSVRHRTWGVFPSTRYPATDPAPRAAVLARLVAVARGGPASPRDALLAALIRGGPVEREVVTAAGGGDARDRLRAAADLDGGPAGLRDVAHATAAAIESNRRAARSASPG